MPTSDDRLSPNPASDREAIRKALQTQADIVGDLRLIECALRTTTDENDPLDRETRLTVLDRATDLLFRRATELDETIDMLEDALSV